MPTAITFRVGTSGQSLTAVNTAYGATEAMRISSSGGVSIGTTVNAGAGNLLVNGNVNAGGGSVVGKLTAYGSTLGSIVVQNAASSAYWITANSASGNFLSIGGNGGTAPASGAINIDSAGSVGIGTTAPTATLEVARVSNPGSGAFGGGASNLLLSASAGSAFGEPAVKFQEVGTNIGAVIAGKNTGNGSMAIVFANRSTASTTSALTEKMRIHQSGGVSVGTTTDPGAGVLAANNGVTSAGTVQSTNGSGYAQLQATGDIHAVRAGGTTGVIYLGNSGSRYLYYDGTTSRMPSSA